MKIRKTLTLIEIIVSLSIIVISILGAAALFSMSMRLTRESKVRYSSAMLAKDLMEEITTKKWDDSATPTPLLNFGPEAGEIRAGTTSLTFWDDIDDYHGLSNNPPQAIDGTLMDGTNQPYPDYSNYRRRVLLFYADETTMLAPAASPPTNYKLIRIIIEYSRSDDFAAPDDAFTLEQIMTNTR